MLALDSTIGCIEVSEPDVLDMYRSAPILTALISGSVPQSCESYVCAIRKKARVQVYVAVVAANQRIFVYTPQEGADTEEHYPHTLQEALNFARSLGFAPERMDLNYSPAMREVVVRNIKILRPPGSKVRAFLRHGMADAPTPAGLNRSGTHKKSQPASCAAASPAHLTGTTQAAASSTAPTATPALSPPPAVPTKGAPALIPAALETCAMPAQSLGVAEPAERQDALARMTDDTSALHKRAQAEVASLRKKLAKALSEGEKAKEELAKVRAELSEGKDARQKGEAGAVSSLQGKLAALHAEKDALAEKVRELSARHLATAAQLAAAVEDRSRLSAGKDALALRIEAVESASSDLAALRCEVAALMVQRDEANRLNRELAAENADRTGALSRAREEIAGLVIEREGMQQQAAQIAAQLVAENRKSGAEREAHLGKLQALSVKLEAAELRAVRFEQESSAGAAEMLALQGEIVALSVKLEAAELRAVRFEKESSAGAAKQQALQGETVALSVKLEAAELRAGILEQESSARVAELQVLQGEIVALSAQRAAAELHPVKPEPVDSSEAAGPVVQAAPPASPSVAPEKLPEQDRESGSVKETGDLQLSKNGPQTADTKALPALEEPACLGAPEKVAEKRQEPTPVTTPWSTGPEPEWFGAPLEKRAAPTFSDADDDFPQGDAEPEGCPGRFLLRADLPAVQYDSPADVVELHQSINLACLSPDGKGSANCQGYICCVRAAGGALQVIVALFAAQSGRTWVYLPEVQPTDQKDYLNAVTGAIDFAEGVGFMMEQVRLEPDRSEAVRRCQVLRCTDNDGTGADLVKIG
jgi:hypothetical protein